MRCEVAQGSVLGSLLFILCINDLQSVTALELIMFADDTNIFAIGRSRLVLNDNLRLISHCFYVNLLSSNLDKIKIR